MGDADPCQALQEFALITGMPVRLDPVSSAVPDIPGLHLNGQNSLRRMEHHEIRLPLTPPPDNGSQPAEGVEAHIII